MTVYRVYVEEVHTVSFTVEAESVDAAREKAAQLYEDESRETCCVEYSHTSSPERWPVLQIRKDI